MKFLIFSYCLGWIGFNSLLLTGQSRWLNLYFGTEDTWGEDFIEYYDNGYLLTGKHGSNYVHYLWLIKTDINGEILWEKTFGESNSLLSFYFLDVNSQGDIFLSGATSYYDPYRDPIVMKLNACGEKEWCRVFNIPNHFDYAHSAIATDDGGCAVNLRYTGVAPPQTDRICLAKLDSQGDLLWKQCYNSIDTNIVNEDSRSLLVTPDNGFLITATCGYFDADSTQMYWPKQYYIKTDSLGNFEWETVVHNDNNKVGGDAWTTTLNPDSTFYYSSVSHYYFETNFSSPAMIKLDLDGNVLAIYDIVNGYINGGLTHAQFINDSIIAAGCGFGNTQSGITTLAVLLDTTGNIINSTELNPNLQKLVLELSFDNKLLYFYDVLENEQFDVYLRKLNLNLEDDTLYTAPFTYDSLCPYQIVSDTIVQDDCGLIVMIEEEEEQEEKEGMGEGERLKIWPNPARDQISIKVGGRQSAVGSQFIEVRDIYGRIITSSPIFPFSPSKEITLDVSSYPPGLYIITITGDRQEILSGKFVICR